MENAAETIGTGAVTAVVDAIPAPEMSIPANTIDMGDTFLNTFENPEIGIETDMDIESNEDLGFEPEVEEEISEELEAKAEEGALEDAREELEEIEAKNNEPVEVEDDSLEQIKLIEETIAMLESQVRMFEESKGSVIVSVMKEIAMYIINDAFFENPQPKQEKPQKLDRSMVNAKIETFKKQIMNLKLVRSILLRRSAASAPQPNLEMGAA